MPVINFDNSATSSPKPNSVKRAALSALTRYSGNPGRSGHRLSIETAEAVYSARQTVADFFEAEPDNAVFALNCTHALNMAIKGIMDGGGHMIISDLEHNSVARPAFALAKKPEYSFSVAHVAYDDGITLNNIERQITSATKAVAFTLGSNVTGQITPYKEIGALCRRYNICFIADGAQVCGTIPVGLGDGINVLCASGHKSLYGAAGTGLLITDGSFPISPIIEGGTGSASLELDQPDYMPDRLESGTLNTVGILSLEAGIRFINKTGIGCIWNHETMLCNLLISGISCLDRIRIYRDERIGVYLPIVLFNIDGLTSNETANLLSDMGFALRGGLHCAGLAHSVIGTVPDGGVRFSPSVFNTENEVKALISAICQIHNSI